MLRVEKYTTVSMVLILDGSSEHGAHVQSETGNLICLSHLFTMTTVFLDTCFASEMF